MLVGEFSDGRSFGMLLVEPRRIVGTFRRDAMPGDEMLRRNGDVTAAAEVVQVGFVRIVDQLRHSLDSLSVGAVQQEPLLLVFTHIFRSTGHFGLR